MNYERTNQGFPIRTEVLALSDTTCPLLRISYTDISKDATAPKPYCSMQIDLNGSGDTKLLVCLMIGASATSYECYQFSAKSTGVADPGIGAGAVDSSPTHAQCTTLGALVTALNAIDGVTAGRLHAPADYSLDTNDFVDMTVATGTRVGPLALEVLFKDAGEVKTCARRIGFPQDAQGKIQRGMLELVRIVGYCNSDSGTDCVFKVSYDPDEVDATKEVELGLTRYIPDAAWTTLWDFSTAGQFYQGPLLIEVTSTSSMEEATTKVNIDFRNAEC